MNGDMIKLIKSRINYVIVFNNTSYIDISRKTTESRFMKLSEAIKILTNEA